MTSTLNPEPPATATGPETWSSPAWRAIALAWLEMLLNDAYLGVNEE